MNDFDEQYEDEPQQALDPNIRKQLREAEKTRKELDSLRAELNAEKREVQFTKAGIPDSGIGELFRKAYDGEANAEAIRSAAEQYGILQSPAPATSSGDSELEALRRAQGATIGTSGALPDPGQEFLSKVKSASSADEVLELVRQTANSNPELGIWTSRASF